MEEGGAAGAATADEEDDVDRDLVSSRAGEKKGSTEVVVSISSTLGTAGVGKRVSATIACPLSWARWSNSSMAFSV